jgi:putative transposase
LSVEVLRWRGWVTYYVLFFLHLETRRVTIAGIPGQPEEMWMEQMARNVTFAGEGCLSLSKGRYRLHDRDAKFCATVPLKE